MKESFLEALRTLLHLDRARVIIPALIISAGAYHFVMGRISEENDFLRRVDRRLRVAFGAREEVLFFSSGTEQPSGLSVYAHIGSALSETRNPFLDVDVRGENALVNIYGVMNNKKAFGLIQEDTYLAAPIAKDQVREITPLYLERLHILYRCEDDVAHPLVLSKVRGEATNYLTKKLESRDLSAGAPTSSAHLLLPHLLAQFKVDRDPFFVARTYSDLDVLLEALQADSIDVAAFTAGVSEPVRQMLAKRRASRSSSAAHSGCDREYHLMGIDPSSVIDFNRDFDQRIRSVDFGGAYEENVPTVGAWALLVASPDVTDHDAQLFLGILNKAADNDPRLRELSLTAPPINLQEVEDAYRSRHNQKTWDDLGAFFVFLISWLGTAAVLGNAIGFVLSWFKKTKYYADLMGPYRAALTPHPHNGSDFDGHMAHALRLTRGMQDLQTLAQGVRADYESGGMTMAHHEYLLRNLTHVFELFQEQLGQRLFVLELSWHQKSNPRRGELLRSITSWHSDGFLKTSTYLSLTGRLPRRG